MISAKRAREITKTARAKENAYIKAVIGSEVEIACEVIRHYACGKNNTCEVDGRSFKYPKRVVAYLKDELGYTADYNPNSGAIKVSW